MQQSDEESVLWYSLRTLSEGGVLCTWSRAKGGCPRGSRWQMAMAQADSLMPVPIGGVCNSGQKAVFIGRVALAMENYSTRFLRVCHDLKRSAWNQIPGEFWRQPTPAKNVLTVM